MAQMSPAEEEAHACIRKDFMVPVAGKYTSTPIDGNCNLVVDSNKKPICVFATFWEKGPVVDAADKVSVPSWILKNLRSHTQKDNLKAVVVIGFGDPVNAVRGLDIGLVTCFETDEGPQLL